VKILLRTAAVIVLCMGSAILAQDVEGQKSRIGIFDPEMSGGENKSVKEIAGMIRENVAAVGGYDILSQETMQKAFAELKLRFPKYCREPRCVSAVGSALQLDRMIYGSIEKGEKTYGVSLVLVDVASKQIVENVSIEGDPGIGIADVIKVAVSRLHGHVDTDLDTTMHTYYGKQMKNYRQFYISAGACLAAGLLWGVLNTDRVDGERVDYGYNLSGVGTGSDLIPLFARPAALGNCYVAASDDAYGVFYNPAGLSWVSAAEASFGYQYRFGMLDNFAASFVNKATREIGFGQGFLYTGDRDNLYSEVTFISSASYRFINWIPFMRPISVGASVKLLSKKTGAGSVGEDAQKGSGFGFGLDIGTQLELSEKIRGGILFKNLPTIIKYNNVSRNAEYTEKEPVEFLMGGTFQANYETFLICEGHIPLYKEQPWKGACGVERVIFRILRLRIGVEKAEGFDTPWKINGGLGINIPTESLWGKYFVFDGSYEYNTLVTFSHVMNFSFRFGF